MEFFISSLFEVLFKEVISVDKTKEYYNELFEKCDILSLHVDLNPASYQMINEKFHTICNYICLNMILVY